MLCFGITPLQKQSEAYAAERDATKENVDNNFLFNVFNNKSKEKIGATSAAGLLILATFSTSAELFLVISILSFTGTSTALRKNASYGYYNR